MRMMVFLLAVFQAEMYDQYGGAVCSRSCFFSIASIQKHLNQASDVTLQSCNPKIVKQCCCVDIF